MGTVAAKVNINTILRSLNVYIIESRGGNHLLLVQMMEAERYWKGSVATSSIRQVFFCRLS